MLVDVLGKNVVWAVWCEILNETEVRCNRVVVKTKAKINTYSSGRYIYLYGYIKHVIQILF